MAELEEEETVAAAPEPEEEVTDLNGAVRGVLLGWPGRWMLIDGCDSKLVQVAFNLNGQDLFRTCPKRPKHLACPTRDLPQWKRDRETLHALAVGVRGIDKDRLFPNLFAAMYEMLRKYCTFLKMNRRSYLKGCISTFCFIRGLHAPLFGSGWNVPCRWMVPSVAFTKWPNT